MNSEPTETTATQTGRLFTQSPSAFGTFSLLSTELILHTASFLDYQSFLSLSLSSRSIRDICSLDSETHASAHRQELARRTAETEAEADRQYWRHYLETVGYYDRFDGISFFLS